MLLSSFLLAFLAIGIPIFCSEDSLSPGHPELAKFRDEVTKCSDSEYCKKYSSNITSQATRIVSDLLSIHLDLEAIDELELSLTTLCSPSKLQFNLQRLLSKVTLRLGDLQYVLSHSDDDDMASMRTHMTALFLTGSESQAFYILDEYQSSYHRRFNKVTGLQINASTMSSREEAWVNLMMTELAGRVALRPPLADLSLMSPIQLSAHQRFYIAIYLMKLGMHDLSIRQLALIATPWEAPLYRTLARLIFPTVHSSMRSMAQAVSSFLQNGESMLLQRSQLHSPKMPLLCESFNEAALAVHALPLLHLAGYSSPRRSLAMGQSPIALPALLSEIFTSMCSTSSSNVQVNSQESRDITIGVVSGSFDGIAGRIVLGILQSLTDADSDIRFVAMCFPTPRDAKTDLAAKLFQDNINLPSANRTLAIQRIQELHPDVILFADAGYDSRVFTLAHERIAAYQMAVW